jgi:FecR protein
MRHSTGLSSGIFLKTRHRRSCWSSCFGVLCLLLAWPAAAIPQVGGIHAVVEVVQMSAWIERDGVRKPLRPGQPLQNRDKVTTGAEARVLIQLADGSTVKLGENAELHLNALDYRNDFVFTGALALVRGAFRLKSGVLPVQRALNVRIATISGGMRKGDLWGVVNEKGDMLCLLEGQVMTVHAKDEERYLSDPPSCYFAPKDRMPKLADDVDVGQVKRGVLQTELQSGVGYASRGEQGQVKEVSLNSEAEALEVYDRARQAGYTASIRPRRAKGGTYVYKVTVTQPVSFSAMAPLTIPMQSDLSFAGQ